MTTGADRPPGVLVPPAGDEQGAHAADCEAAAEADLFAGELRQFEGQAIAPPARRGPGRPPGSPNRTTAKVREWLTALGYRDPLEAKAALATADPRELAARLAGHGDVQRVTFDEAMAVVHLQERARADLMPYWHQQQPKALEVKRDEVRHLVIVRDGGPAKGEADQRVIEALRVASHDAGSHGQGEGIEFAELFGGSAHD